MSSNNEKKSIRVKNSSARQRNVQIILKAAEDVFVTSGFKGASIRDIAMRAGLPKANVHYYFSSKVDLYTAVLNHITQLWESIFEGLHPDDDPAESIRAFIKAKMEYIHAHPNASRILSCEILHAGNNMDTPLEPFNQWVKEKSAVIQGWIDEGKMRPVDPVHLLLHIWSTTQFYVDYAPQVAVAMNKDQLASEDMTTYTDNLCQVILSGCGLAA